MGDVENAALDHAQRAAAHVHDHKIRYGLASVAIVCAYCGIWHFVGMTAKHSSEPLAIALLVFSFHALYLMIYALGRYRFISEASTEHERWLLIDELVASFYRIDLLRVRNICATTTTVVLLVDHFITHTYFLKSSHPLKMGNGGPELTNRPTLLLYGAIKTKACTRYGGEIADLEF